MLCFSPMQCFRFHTPVMFSEAELSELRGTPLFRAAGIIKGRLRELWKGMQPALGSMLAGKAGVQRQATFEDLLWAYSVFWSRGQSLPVPHAGSGEEEILSILV